MKEEDISKSKETEIKNALIKELYHLKEENMMLKESLEQIKHLVTT